MNIAIVSGKGGTGKTTVATNLFEVLRLDKLNVELIDANVEQPNAHLFIKHLLKADGEYKSISNHIPSFDPQKCTFCGRCVHYCAYEAIVMLKDLKQISVHEEICKSCGACTYACNDGAITELKKEIGELHCVNTDNYKFIEGELLVGSTGVKPLIKALKTEILKDRISIIDSPPSISSIVSEIVFDASFVIIVAEPSVFGLHDLKLIVKNLNDLRKDFGVVVNKYRGEFNEVHQYLEENDIPLLMNIPFKSSYAKWYSQGMLIVNEDENIKSEFYNLFEEVKRIYIQKSMYR